MAHGINIYDSAGNLVLDGSKRVGRILGSFDSGTTPGSLVITNDYGTGTLFGFAVGMQTSTVIIAGGPRVYFSGNTLYWDWAYLNYAGYKSNARVIYGVY